jgi:XRE family aerobic/anaerobic benzoate catabolism transcriptional regulator
MSKSRRKRRGGGGRGRLPAGRGAKLVPPTTEDQVHALLAQRVRYARAQRFMTRKQLAEQSGISLAYLGHIENGTGNISLGLLHRLALALNLPIVSLLAPEEHPNADLTLIVEFLKRRGEDELARIRRQLFDGFGPTAKRDAARIALIGIRGVGKSTVGPLLAGRLGVPFVELNREIEKEAGLVLNEIFMLYGQRGYRQFERRCLERVIVSHPRVVLATGGGLVTEAGTYEVLLSSFFAVWLKARPQIMFERVLAQHDARIASPKLRSEALENIAHTLEARRHLYELAHMSFDTSGRNPAEVVAALLEVLPSRATGGPGEVGRPGVVRKLRP